MYTYIYIYEYTYIHIYKNIHIASYAILLYIILELIIWCVYIYILHKPHETVKFSSVAEVPFWLWSTMD